MAEGSGIGARDILIALPVLGTALAVTYDVGYFWGLDINLFSAFSLAEHITFALEYVPFALALSSIAIIGPFAAQWGSKGGREAAEHEARSGKKMPFYKKGINWFAFVWCLLLIFWCWYSRSATSFVWLVFFVTVVAATSFRVTLAHIIALISSTVIVAFVAAFALGFDSANSYRKSEKYIHTITPLQARR
jgi:hypothetical protein